MPNDAEPSGSNDDDNNQS